MDSSELITLWVKAHGEGVLSQDAPTGASYRMPTDPAPSRPEPVPSTVPIAQDQLPDFELGEELGRGGMGQVFRARQISLDRDVAIKVIRAEQRTARARERFLAEARVSGALDHPNIVPVHALGETRAGHVFLVMKRVSGRSWKALMHPPSGADHLAILSSVCNAVAFAHARGIVHRDLKPENVMVGAFGEVMVMDWGIAVDIREAPVDGSPAPHRTQCTAPAGTPVYMPPELAMGHGERIGPWTDSYLLGAILCEVLTGAPPHRGASLAEILHAAAKSEPPSLPPEVPADLAAVVRKALAAEPADRYQTALELQAAIQQHLTCRESERIAAGAAKRLEAARSAGAETADARRKLYSELADITSAFGQALVLWPENAAAADAQRAARLLHARLALAGGDLGLARAQLEALDRPEAALLAEVAAAEALATRREIAARRVRRTAGALAIALVIGLAVGFVWIRAERNEAQAQREAAEKRRQEAERARDSARKLLTDSLVAQGDAMVLLRDHEAARQRYTSARDPGERTYESTVLPDLGLLDLYRRAPRPVMQLGRAERATASRRNNNPTRECVAFSPDGRRILTGGADQVLSLYDALTGQLLRVLTGHYARITGAVFLSGDRAASVGDDGHLRQWDLATGRELRAIRLGATATAFFLEDLTLCDGGRTLVVACSDGHVSQVDVASGEVRKLAVEDAQEPGSPRPKLKGLSVTPGGHRMLAVTEGKTSPRVWSLLTGKVIQRLTAGGAGIQLGVISPDGRRVALATWTSEIMLLSCPEGKLLGRLNGHRSRLEKLMFSPDSKLLASASQDETARLWDVSTFKEVRAFTGDMDAVLSVAFSPDGTLLATGGADGAVRIWPVSAAPEVKRWDDVGPVGAIEFIAGGRLAVVQQNGAAPHFVDVGSGTRLGQARMPPKLSGRARSAAGGRALVCATSEPPALHVIDAETGRAFASKSLSAADVPGSYGLAVSPDGSRVFTLHTEIADPETGGTLANPDARVAMHMFEGTGLTPERDLAGLQFIVPAMPKVQADNFSSLRILGAAPAGVVNSVKGGGFDCVEVSPDGAWLAGASSLLVVRDARNGQFLRACKQRPYGLRRVAISPDSRWVASCGSDRFIYIADAATGENRSSINNESGAVLAVAFSPDNRLLAAAGASGDVALFDPGSGRRVRSFAGHTAMVSEVSFSPDGRWLVSGGVAETLAWDLTYPRRVAKDWAAIDEARAKLDSHPPDRPTLVALARWYLLRGLAKPARTLLAEAKSALTTEESIQLALLENDPSAALDIAVRELDDRGSTLPPVYLRRLRMGLNAVVIAKKLAARDADADRALKQANDCVDLEDWRGALAAVAYGLSLRPNDPNLLARRARAHLGLREFDQALAAARDWTRVAPDDAAAHYGHYIVLVRKDDLDAAVPVLRRVLEVRGAFHLGYLHESVLLATVRAARTLRRWTH